MYEETSVVVTPWTLKHREEGRVQKMFDLDSSGHFLI